MANKRSAGKKGGAKRAGARAAARKANTAAAAAGNCLSLLAASQIVQDAAGGPHDIDKTLEEVGFISDNQRRIFREDVFEGVLDEGCDINRGEIPNGGDDTLREIRDTIADTARPRAPGAAAAAGLAVAKAAGGCISLFQADQIVQKAANGPHGIYKTLKEVGLITGDQRKIFVQDVQQQVQAANCKINIADIPDGLDNTLREVRDAIQAKAT